MGAKTTNCPCGGADYAQCCGRYLESNEAAPDAERLMRSRYSAYVLGKDVYLQQTWHASTRPTGSLTDSTTKWLGLEVRNHHQQGDEAQVEFVARYKVGGRAHRLHERSRFVREEGKWYYVDGSFPEGKA
ncbi:MAG TPA: YchJ family metal-binding protein [Noviherbaspirillum sp.]